MAHLFGQPGGAGGEKADQHVVFFDPGAFRRLGFVGQFAVADPAVPFAQNDLDLGLGARGFQSFVNGLGGGFFRHDAVGRIVFKPELEFPDGHGRGRGHVDQPALETGQGGEPGFRHDGDHHVHVLPLLDAVFAQKI